MISFVQHVGGSLVTVSKVTACVVWSMIKLHETKGSSIPAFNRTDASLDLQHSFPSTTPSPLRHCLPFNLSCFYRGEESPWVLFSLCFWSHGAGRSCHNPAAIDRSLTENLRCFFFSLSLSLLRPGLWTFIYIYLNGLLYLTVLDLKDQ